MSGYICVFDCETVPDCDSLREAYGYEGDDKSVAQMALEALINFDIGCKFDKNSIDRYDNLITQLNTLLKNNEFISINLPAITPSVSDAISTQNNELLHIKVLNSAMQKAQLYSNELGKNCVLNSVDFTGTSHPAVYANLKSTQTPIESKQSQTLSATATYNCK